MKLEPVRLEFTQVMATCRICGQTKNVKHMFADKDGVPFYDYYCETCVYGGKVDGREQTRAN